MIGLIVIVAVVALALTLTIRIHNKLAVLRRRAGESQGAAETYNAAIEAFPARLIARTLGFHPHMAED